MKRVDSLLKRAAKSGILLPQYVGIVPSLPGAHTQGATLDKLGENLKEVIEEKGLLGLVHLERKLFEAVERKVDLVPAEA